MDLQTLFEEGRHAAAEGLQCLDSPYRIGYDGWVGMAWLRGFLAGRTPDPACPSCHGSGRLLFEPSKPEDYGGEFDCVCNVRRKNAEPGGRSVPEANER